MASISDVDLTTSKKPPTALYITVRALEDCGDVLGADGTSIRLEKHSELLVRREDVEMFIKQGRVVEIAS